MTVHRIPVLYVGIRTGQEICTVTVHSFCGRSDGTAHPLSLYTNVRNHSPTGFGWGYAGSGPAQLALAILCDYLYSISPDGWQDRAERLHQKFKAKVVQHLPREGWTLSGHQVAAAIDALEFERVESDRP